MINIALNISLIIFTLGVCFQIYRFKKYKNFLHVETSTQGSQKNFQIKAFLLNTLFQTKLFKAGKLRWIFHFSLFTGFLYLIFVHALHDVTSLLFEYYEPTVDPFQFLRNFSGVMVFMGCIAFLYRRVIHYRIKHDKRIKTKGLFSILLILLVIGSGFLLEASKIISEPVFIEMVEEYSDIDEETGLEDLKIYWKEYYNIIFSQQIDITDKSLENGQFLNEEYCLSCHSSIRSAFVSNTFVKMLNPIGSVLNSHRLDSKLSIIHYILCLLLLACFPFSRLFHVLLIPFITGQKNITKETSNTSKGIIPSTALFACTNCGYCSRVCSVYPNYQITGNKDVLPHSKIESVKAMIKDVSSENWERLYQGNSECTMCHNCTDICPSGIDLQCLWVALDTKLVQMRHCENIRSVKDIPLNEWAKNENTIESLLSKDEMTSNLADKAEAFEKCVQCTICTNVCPVVEYNSNQNDMTPQQVMNLLRLGKKHLATGTRMVWSCLTCYSCQEHCPQQIRVTDIILELRNSGEKSAGIINKTQTNTEVHI